MLSIGTHYLTKVFQTETNILKIIYFYYMKTQYGQYKTFPIWISPFHWQGSYG